LIKIDQNQSKSIKIDAVTVFSFEPEDQKHDQPMECGCEEWPRQAKAQTSERWMAAGKRMSATRMMVRRIHRMALTMVLIS
jgi:hypothetical protein